LEAKPRASNSTLKDLSLVSEEAKEGLEVVGDQSKSLFNVYPASKTNLESPP
jgi:hypothetical protein